MIQFNNYRTLFISTFSLSMFTIGGGLVIVPLMHKKFVEELKWIDNDEMLNLISIAQTCPGVMAVNASIALGRKIGGLKGSIVALLGSILPPFIILSLISFFYNNLKDNELFAYVLYGLQIVIAAIIISAALSLFRNLFKKNKYLNICIFLLVIIVNLFTSINIIVIILVTLLLSITFYLIKGDKL